MKTLVRSCAVLAWLALPPPAALADGFGVYTQGARATGMGGAWVARVMDPSAVFYNVAGMSQLSGTQVYVGATTLINSGNGVTLFDGERHDQVNQTFLIPHLYLTHEVSSRFAAGVGVYTPYGLGTQWDKETFPGRFRSYEADIQSIFIQPSVSFAPRESFSIGGGVSFVYADVGLNRQTDLSTLVLNELGTTFGQVTGLPPNTQSFLDTEFEASGTGFGYNVGVLLSPTPVFQIGLAYRSQVEIDFEGDATFAPVATGIVLGPGNPLGAPAGTPLDAVLAGRLPSDQEASTTVVLPDQVVGGISLSPSESWMVNADVKWTNWEDFDELVLDFANENPGEDVLEPAYENGTSWRIGAEWLATPSIALRAGYIRDENPVPQRSVTPLLPDADRNEFSLGFGYTTGPWQIDAFYLREIFKERAGPVGIEDDLPDGIYDTTGNLFGLDVGYRL
ncbi:MAG: OmpP1/FadL family transporter [Gemmatimonadota bacterium]